jgi:hypothetical protein
MADIPEKAFILFIFPTHSVRRIIQLFMNHYKLPNPKISNPVNSITKADTLRSGIEKNVILWQKTLMKDYCLIANFNGTPISFMHTFFKRHTIKTIILLPDNWVHFSLIEREFRLKKSKEIKKVLRPDVLLRSIDYHIEKLHNYINFIAINNPSTKIINLSNIIDSIEHHERSTLNQAFETLSIINNPIGEIKLQQIKVFVNDEKKLGEQLLGNRPDIKTFIHDNVKYYSGQIF